MILRTVAFVFCVLLMTLLREPTAADPRKETPMLLVIESRTDLIAVPVDTNPRSTERALAHMAWPFPIDTTVPPPRRGWPVQASTPVPTTARMPPLASMEPRRAARRVDATAPRFELEFAEVH